MTATAYRYQFETGGKKHRCPRCGQKRFVRYVDASTGELMPSEFGRCDREERCQYWMKPDSSTSAPFAPVKMPPPPPPTMMQPEMMAASVAHGHSSTFARWLQERYGADMAADAAKRYRLGASKHWQGATVFWQVDASGRIRGGKVMQYDATGHRVKVPSNRVTWVHSVLRLEGYNLRQCYFGEHLLNERPSDPVAIVESEKTAIVASLEIPAFVWIATGGKNGCRWKTDATVNAPLRGRNVTLFPDLGAFADWQDFAQRLRDAGAQAKVNDLLERHATEDERANGLDLADYLLRQQPAPDTDTQRGAAMMQEASPKPSAMIAARPQEDITPKAAPVTVTAATSGTITPERDPMHVPIDWARLNEPAEFELDPF